MIIKLQSFGKNAQQLPLSIIIQKMSASVYEQTSDSW